MSLHGSMSNWFPIPDPPLVHPAGHIVLRPWLGEDHRALVEAWMDPDIAAHCGVPPDAGPERAAAWLAGWSDRAAGGSSLDLVVADALTEEVLGEVGISPFRVSPNGAAAPGVLELGWWIGAPHRSAGRAATAVSLLTDWALDALGAERVVARIRPGHLASEAVATSAGLTRRGRLDDHHALWVRAGPPRSTRLWDGSSRRRRA